MLSSRVMEGILCLCHVHIGGWEAVLHAEVYCKKSNPKYPLWGPTVVRETWTAGHNRMVHNQLKVLCNGRLSPQAEALGAGTGPYSPSCLWVSIHVRAHTQLSQYTSYPLLLLKFTRLLNRKTLECSLQLPLLVTKICRLLGQHLAPRLDGETS